jgi:hypothetical protein
VLGLIFLRYAETRTLIILASGVGAAARLSPYLYYL